MTTELTRCLCCDGDDLRLVLDLNDQPLANSYPSNQMDEEMTFPLRLNFCQDCTHLQLSHAVDPDLLFKHYIYVSGTSKTLIEYFEWFIELTKRYVKNKTRNVLDIACNDGTQLDLFYNSGYNTYGIDPAQNLHHLSSRNSQVICDYLTEDNIQSFGVQFDVILAQNVFAHNSYPLQFLQYCKSVLAPGGRLFVQTSQANMIQNNEFDTIYHEHLSFFSVKSFCTIAKRAGLGVVDVLKTPIHGTSYVFILSADQDDMSDFMSAFLMSAEPELNWPTLRVYAERCGNVMADLTEALNRYGMEGYRLVGYGAAAKGNTLLNFGNVVLDYIVDDNPLKCGLFTPGMRIPIKSPEVLKSETSKTLIVPLAWNFYPEIKQKALALKPDASFIRYFPHIVEE